MYIVIEGTDNAGKSTLARNLQQLMGHIRIVSSEGPEKYPGEINERVLRYFEMSTEPILFDRHPAVSNQIYRQIKDGYTSVSPELLERFYGNKPFFIYCRPIAKPTLDGHVLRDHDTPDHMAAVASNLDKLVALYDAWACKHAHVIYRIGQPIRPVLSHIKETIHVRNFTG